MADNLPPEPEGWEEVPMGAGQGPRGPLAHLQVMRNTSEPHDIRREPGSFPFIVVHRWPERPV